MIGRAEVFPSRQRIGPAALDGLAIRLCFTAALVTLDACAK